MSVEWSRVERYLLIVIGIVRCCSSARVSGELGVGLRVTVKFLLEWKKGEYRSAARKPIDDQE